MEAVEWRRGGRPTHWGRGCCAIRRFETVVIEQEDDVRGREAEDFQFHQLNRTPFTLTEYESEPRGRERRGRERRGERQTSSGSARD